MDQKQYLKQYLEEISRKISILSIMVGTFGLLILKNIDKGGESSGIFIGLFIIVLAFIMPLIFEYMEKL